MPQLNQLIEKLEFLYQTWAALSKKRCESKINYILPFVNAASYLIGLIEVGVFEDDKKMILLEARLKKIINNFEEKYAEFYQVNLLDIGWSDFSTAEFKQIEEVQKGKIAVTEDLRQKIARKIFKFEHAHSKIADNYAILIKCIAQCATRPEEERRAIKESLQQKSHEFFSGLEKHGQKCEINKLVEDFHLALNIEKNNDLLPLDNVEDEGLLCQISNFRNNVAYSLRYLNCVPLERITQALHLKEKGKIITKAVLQQRKKNQGAAREVVKYSRQILKRKNSALQMDMRIGFESEFLLRQLDEPDWNLENVAELNEKVKKSLSDVNDRRLVQKQYGAVLTIPATKDIGLFLQKITLKDLPKGRRREIRKIWSHLTKTLGVDYKYSRSTVASNKPSDAGSNSDSNSGSNNAFNLAQIKEKILYFTDAEIYFYKLLLLSKKKLKIDVKPLYHSDQSDYDNLQVMIPFIMKNLLHANLLDGFRVYEVDIGHYSLQEALPRLEEARQKMKNTSEACGLSLDNPNVQINTSFVLNQRNIFMPEIIENSEGKKVYLNKLGIEMIRLLQEAIAKAGEVPGVLRGQVEIAACLDKKKSIGKDLENTPYMEVNSDLSAYALHRILTGKGDSVRLSVFSKAEGVAVVEIRLIGNNPHFATLPVDEEFAPGLEYIPQILLPLMAQKIAEFMSSKSDEELLEMLEEKIELLPDGVIRDSEGVTKAIKGEGRPEETMQKVAVEKMPEELDEDLSG